MAPAPDHLVLVAGHAIYVGGPGGNPLDETAWCLQPFQRGEPPYYIEHIRAGVDAAAADRSAVVISSGGETRPEAGPRSEARGYFAIAVGVNWWGAREVASRADVEEFARDSFENLLFGIARFRERTGHYPGRVTVVSWAFKAARFDRHRAAIRFPADRFTFISANQPPDLAAAERGEARVLAEFARDPYGASGALAAKRVERNPFHRAAPYSATCPELAELLAHRGPEMYTGALPW